MPCAPSVLQQYGNILTVASISVAPTGSDLYPGRRIFTADTFREYLWDGTGWIIMSEPPQTWSGMYSMTGQTGSGWYHRSDGYCDFYAAATFSGALGGSNVLTLPFALHASGTEVSFPGIANDAGVGRTMVDAFPLSASTLSLGVRNASGTYLFWTAVSAAVPHTWGVSDVLATFGRYRMATRYL